MLPFLLIQIVPSGYNWYYLEILRALLFSYGRKSVNSDLTPLLAGFSSVPFGN